MSVAFDLKAYDYIAIFFLEPTTALVAVILPQALISPELPPLTTTSIRSPLPVMTITKIIFLLFSKRMLALMSCYPPLVILCNDNFSNVSPTMATNACYALLVADPHAKQFPWALDGSLNNQQQQ
jgi:hypothetical protein